MKRGPKPMSLVEKRKRVADAVADCIASPMFEELSARGEGLIAECLEDGSPATIRSIGKQLMAAGRMLSRLADEMEGSSDA